MKRNWSVKHRGVEHPAAQRRWNSAYQLLMELSQPAVSPLPPVQADALSPLALPEQHDEHCHLCPSLDSTPGSSSDY
ncbi:MAG TPA: hypothetical protein V6C65_38775 [Allocoleopsis sp.]